jgi:subtilisin family serine protease
MSGTSMAAPHAGGTAALYLSTHTGASAAEVEAALSNASTLTGTKSKDSNDIYLLSAGTF